MTVVEASGADTTAVPRVVTHLTEEESKAKGKKARDTAPRDSHAVFEPRSDRPDPVALLEEQGTTRVPELVPIRYGRMVVSPFTFFRGAALVMASDLSGTRARACTPRSAATPTSPTSASSARPSASSSSTATISTRRSPVPGSGT